MEPYSGNFLNRNEGLLSRVYIENETISSFADRNDKVRTHRRMDGRTELFPSEKGTESFSRVDKEEIHSFRDVRMNPRRSWRIFIQKVDLFNNKCNAEIGYSMPMNVTTNNNDKVKNYRRMDGRTELFPSGKRTESFSRVGKEEKRSFRDDLFYNTLDAEIGFFMPINVTADKKTRYVTFKDARIGKNTHFCFFSAIFSPKRNVTYGERIKGARTSRKTHFWFSSVIFISYSYHSSTPFLEPPQRGRGFAVALPWL